MRVIVVYESMFGNTRVIAEAIGAGLQDGNDVVVIPVARAATDLLHGADLVVAGGPTHIHGMSRASTRKAAAQMARKPDSIVRLEAEAEGPGLRDWLASIGQVDARAAAFDTRLEGCLAPFTGRASKAISKLLRTHGFSVITRPESFLVTRGNQLRTGEHERARRWGEELAAKINHASVDAR